MNKEWEELKETIIEMRDNDGTLTQQEVCKFLANLMDVLEKQMSSSENQNKWIPVSERLPKEHKEVLTCDLGGYIEIQSFEDSYDGYWENRNGDWSDLNEIIAWMPLPQQPYKAEIKYKGEQTDKIEESNFSMEQYEADLKGAYDCGYNSGYADAMIDIAESEVEE